MKRFGALLIALGLVLSACGSDDGGSGGDALANALDKVNALDAVSGQFNDGGTTSGMTAEQEACVGLGMLQAVGAKTLIEANQSDELILNEADATKAADAFFNCVDIRDIFAETFAADGEISEKSAKCLAADIDNDDMRPFLIESFQGLEGDDAPPELLAKMFANMATCLTPEELVAVGS